MPSVVVLGANGMLGHKLCQRLESRPLFGLMRPPLNVYADVFGDATMRGGIDAFDDSLLADVLGDVAPDVVVNCVGIIRQSPKMKDRETTISTNAWFPHRLARLCREIHARLIHISTDCIFDGKRGLCSESDVPQPYEFYGMTKLLGEVVDRNAITLRASFIGREIRRPTRSLLEWFLTKEGQSIPGFAKAIYSGFSTIEAARIIQLVIDQRERLSGIYHIASSPINKFALLCLLRDAFHLSVDIQPDNRMRCNHSLDMSRFSSLTGYVSPSWEKMAVELAEESGAN